MPQKQWIVGPNGELPVDADGQAVAIDSDQPDQTQPHIRRVSAQEVRALTGKAQRCFDAESLTVVAHLANEENLQFDPLSGLPLTPHPTRAGVKRTAEGTMVFPRIDPAVIGRVQLAGTDYILLGRNAQRSSYFSLIAGYVDLGETFEQAFAREVLEESGRRLSQVQYLRSQPWPFSSSIMVGMHAITKDEQQVTSTDGELLETRWLSPDELRRGVVPLPAEGSIAHALIQEWCS
ncbi:NAD(+) diphosphatase [Corynebacterium pseudopelargi]|uniref:NAD(+) diphosphatase n=1 Tax=Corynebacterium pseudopelargi TaxID=2080757 RepID=A0A3G6IVW1_9CORY|nr:NUDIX domain-containing protein [Corynebacterium pseudopelargi]AZA09796.1 NADH pyrophosphatase [Corynebacterium pseudopelargi]